MESSYETRIINHALKTCGYYPLRAMQRWIVDSYFVKVNTTMMNIFALLKLDASIDLNRLAAAINDTVNTYDIFRSRLVFHPATNDLCQRFDGEIEPVVVEEISDEEFERRKGSLRLPYRIINKPLYRINIFKTPTTQYFYADFHHVIMDGTSAMYLFTREIDLRYNGRKIAREPLNYADYLLDEMKVSPEELAAGNKFWRDMLHGFDESRHLLTPDIHDGTTWRSENLAADIKNIDRKYFKGAGITETNFFLAAAMLALAKSIGVRDSILSWIHNGRTNMQERRLMGIMIEEFPISWNFEADITVGDFLSGLEEKVNTSIRYRRSIGTVYEEGLEDATVTFVFQKGTSAIEGIAFAGTTAEVIDLPPDDVSAAENSLDIMVNLMPEGNYLLFLDYDASRYSEAAIERFAATFDEMVMALQDKGRMISTVFEG